MSERLTHHDFAAFFRDVHDHEPFPWQIRLTEQVLSRCEWPDVIDLPTGVGKTAALDTAIFALAARPDISPRRVVFVIDRRIVVDQVYERAERIKRRLESGGTRVLRRVGDSLAALSGGETLGVAALRGGVPIDHEWTHRPDQPWVVVSTVDQFGSRLLFRGYGVTQRMRPVHAGLAGNDCLVILDEVHLSVPFAQTLARVGEMRSEGLPRRFAVVEMSATPSNRDAKRFQLEAADVNRSEELRRRVDAAKEAELVSVRNEDAIPGAVLKIVKATAKSKPTPVGKEGDSKSVGVVVNRVRTARETHRKLIEADITAHLITGRMRPLDRVAALEKIKPLVDPDSDQRPDGTTAVVATQAIEVGADFSFDALITECASVDSLRQRFGRLDRRGAHFARTCSPARAWIIGPKTVVASKKPDPIYGVAVKVTWEELERRFEKGRPVDVGPRSLRDFPDEATAPNDRAPLLLSTYMDAWAQTSPEPIVQPSVEWFLHGIEQDRAADVSIAWRTDRTTETLRLVPPRQAEFLQVPIDAARSWLSGGDELDVADVGREFEPDHEGATSQGADWVRWEGSARKAEDIGVREISPGDVLIVDPGRGGLKAGTWDPSSTDPVEDLGDTAQMVYGKKATLRLDPRLSYVGSPPLPSDEDGADTPARERIEEWLNQRTENQDSPLVAEALERLAKYEVTETGDSESRRYYVLTEKDSQTHNPVVDAVTMDGSDEVNSLTSTGVTLKDHMDGVGGRAASIAERLGLSAGVAEDLRLAGQLHDLGKVDRRFQEQLVGGDHVESAMLEEPLAKSLPGIRWGEGYPGGMRHEMASVALAESNPGVLASAYDKDLVLHLVGTHHGYGRPMPPIIEDEEPQLLSYKFDGHSMEASSDLAEGTLALDMADRFWRLIERYGYYGLAWLEAILRLADHRQSEAEAEQS